MGICSGTQRKPANEIYIHGGQPLAWFRREVDGQKEADCFYLHPTTEIGLMSYNINYDNYSTGTVLTGPAAGTPDLWETQAVAMADTCNMWAPRYSQLGMLALGVPSGSCSDDKYKGFMVGLKTVLDDVKAAFAAFLEERPDKTRPFFIFAHSQGSILMTKVIKDCLCGTEHQKRFVAAYLPGGYVPCDVADLLGGGMHICDGPEDTNCIISWDTRLKDIYKPDSIHDGMLALWPHYLYWWMFDKYGEQETRRDPDSKPRVQVNPCTWKQCDGKGNGPGYLGAKQYGEQDPVLPADAADFSQKIDVTTGHCLWIEDPRAWLKKNDAGPAADGGNLHPVDVSMWFYNIKENVPKRLAAFKKNSRR